MKYLLFLILLVIVLITTGCVSPNKNTVVTPTQSTGISSEPIVGIWQWTAIDGSKLYTFTFFSDGRYSFTDSSDPNTLPGTWSKVRENEYLIEYTTGKTQALVCNPATDTFTIPEFSQVQAYRLGARTPAPTPQIVYVTPIPTPQVVYILVTPAPVPPTPQPPTVATTLFQVIRTTQPTPIPTTSCGLSLGCPTLVPISTRVPITTSPPPPIFTLHTPTPCIERLQCFSGGICNCPTPTPIYVIIITPTPTPTPRPTFILPTPAPTEVKPILPPNPTPIPYQPIVIRTIMPIVTPIITNPPSPTLPNCYIVSSQSTHSNRQWTVSGSAGNSGAAGTCIIRVTLYNAQQYNALGVGYSQQFFSISGGNMQPFYIYVYDQSSDTAVNYKISIENGSPQ